MRYNPSESLADRPELAAEISFGDRWERVSIEDASESGTLSQQLLQSMSEAPGRAVRVRGDLLTRQVRWGQGHSSRVLIILELTPPEE